MSEDGSSTKAVDLPPSWEVRGLCDIAIVIQGQSPPGSSYNTDSLGLPFFQGKAEFGPMSPTPVKWCTQPSKVAERGDVLVSVRAPVGPTNVADTTCCIGRGLAAIRPYDQVPPRFILYYLRHSVSLLASQATGTTFQAISGDQLRKHPVPMASVAEQHRIVEAIESYLTRLDDAVATLKGVQRNLKRYRASVLKAAVEGRLVPTEAELARAEGRSYEPASTLLESILAERRRRWEEAELTKMQAKGKTPKDDKWKAKYAEPTAPDTTGLPELPEGWCWATWGQVGFSQNGRAFPSSEYCDDGVRLLRPGNLHISGRVEWTPINTRYMPASWERDFPGFVVGPGELVMNLTAQSLKDEFLGRVCVTAAGERCLLNQRIARLTPVRLGVPFVLCWLKTPLFRTFVDTLNTGSLIQHMFTSQLDVFAFPLPPLAEQDRIVAEVERHAGIAETIEGDIGRIESREARLRQSILKWAFEGRLVDQDPTDEPASILLERIRAERESAAQARPSTRKRARQRS